MDQTDITSALHKLYKDRNLSEMLNLFSVKKDEYLEYEWDIVGGVTVSTVKKIKRVKLTFNRLDK